MYSLCKQPTLRQKGVEDAFGQGDQYNDKYWIQGLQTKQIFSVLVLCNFELKQTHSTHNSQNTVGSHLENAFFYVFTHIKKICII